MNDGRRPRLVSARSVNWLMASSWPPTSSSERLVIPASSRKMRSSTHLRAMVSATIGSVATGHANQHDQARSDLADHLVIHTHHCTSYALKQQAHSRSGRLDRAGGGGHSQSPHSLDFVAPCPCRAGRAPSQRRTRQCRGAHDLGRLSADPAVDVHRRPRPIAQQRPGVRDLGRRLGHEMLAARSRVRRS